jgi:hypothetical protein
MLIRFGSAGPRNRPSLPTAIIAAKPWPQLQSQAESARPQGEQTRPTFDSPAIGRSRASRFLAKADDSGNFSARSGALTLRLNELCAQLRAMSRNYARDTERCPGVLEQFGVFRRFCPKMICCEHQSFLRNTVQVVSRSAMPLVQPVGY